MSWQATKWAMVQGLPLAPGAVLKSLAYHAHSDGTSAHPGVKLIAYESGLSERAVQENLRLLEDWGGIETTSKKGGRGSVTVYSLPRMQDVKGEPETPFDLHPLRKGRTSRQERVNLETEKGEPDDTAYKEGTVIEPSIEPSSSVEKATTKQHLGVQNDTWKPPDWYLAIFTARKKWIVAKPSDYVQEMESLYSAEVLLQKAGDAGDWCKGHPAKKGTTPALKQFFRNWMKAPKWSQNGRSPQEPSPSGKTIGNIMSKPQVDV